LRKLIEIEMAKKLIFSSLVAALLAGCGAMVPVVKQDDLTAQQRREVNEVAIFNSAQLVGKDFTVLNIVEGISCKNKTWDPAATRSDAIFQARYWAKQMGADGITNLQCDHPRGTTTTYNCWESITCSAEAIKLK
jgi:uncharacterized protein YbjQ (UPF0145 family)